MQGYEEGLRNGEDAPIRAVQRAVEFRDWGDTEGKVVWKRIIIALEKLMRTERKDGEPVN